MPVKMFPIGVETHYLPMADDEAFKIIYSRLSSSSRQHLRSLQTIQKTEIDFPIWKGYGLPIAHARGRHLFLAKTVDTDDVIGYAVCIPTEQREENIGIVLEIIVLPEYRRRGIGTALIREIEAVAGNSARAQGIQPGPMKALLAIIPAQDQKHHDFFIKVGYRVLSQGDTYLFARDLPA